MLLRIAIEDLHVFGVLAVELENLKLDSLVDGIARHDTFRLIWKKK